MKHCLNALGANSPVFLIDSGMRPVRPTNNIIDRDKLLQEVKKQHKAIPRIVWVTEERFEAIWGDRAEEKKKECDEKLKEVEALGADVSNPDGYRFFRIATESRDVDMIAYAQMLFQTNWEEDTKEHVHLYL